MNTPAEQILLDALKEYAQLCNYQNRYGGAGNDGNPSWAMDDCGAVARVAIEEYNKLNSEPALRETESVATTNWPTDEQIQQAWLELNSNHPTMPIPADRKHAFKAGVAWVKNYLGVK